MEQTTMNNKPKPRRVRGTGTYVGDEFTFTPYEQGEPAQRNVKACRGGKTYETSSAKSPLRVAYLTCPADAADPWSEFTGQLQRLGIKPQKEHALPARQRLVSEGGMEVYLNQKEGVLTYQGTIDLGHSYNWQSEVMRQLQVIVRTLPGDEKFKKFINKIKKEIQQHV
ncbi:MAG: hypothetical protein II949_15355 [Prevotella sp.]|nr:hypothetical protein [Prevotella sp.]